MGEDHQGRAAGEPLDVLLEPVELRLPEATEPARLEVEHIDQADEVDALVVEALPPGARGPAEPAQILLPAVGEDVVLARYVEDPLRLGALERFAHGVEGARLLRVGEVARMNDEGRRRLDRLDARNRLLECAERILVGLALEADVRIADLDEAEAAGGVRAGRRGLTERRG